MLKRLHPALPVLMISSAPVTPETREAAWAAGASCCLSEPIGRDTLVSSIADAIAGLTEHGVSGTWVVTDPLGFILEASLAVARLLNVTVRGLQQRNLVVFFERDRAAWQFALTRALSGERVVQSGSLRPKERRPLMLTVEISRATAWQRPALRWIFQLSNSPTG
jgi:hypothetical protein